MTTNGKCLQLLSESQGEADKTQDSRGNTLLQQGADGSP